jgi:outer membrane protein assembly factor BamA
VPANQYLLTKNAVIYRSDQSKKKSKGLIGASESNIVAKLTVSPEINSTQVITYIKQKTNTKILGLIPLHLFIYNSVDSAKAEYNKKKRNDKIDEKYRKKNEERIAKGESPIPESKIKAKKAKKTAAEWWMNAGESPVIFDSTLMAGSLKQIKLFLQSKGYFQSKVHDSVAVKKKKAKVFYIIDPGKPYKINSIHYTSEDTALLPEIHADSVNCLLNVGDNYNYDMFSKERDRIAAHLNNIGYYKFASPYVYYDIDSALGDHKMNVTIGISKYAEQDKKYQNADSIIKVAHSKYSIRKVFIQMNYNPSATSYYAGDTIWLNNYIVVFPDKKPGFKPNHLLNKIFIRQGDVYDGANVDYTYTGLAQLKTFRYIAIRFATVGKDQLDCYIQLALVTKQSIGIDGELDDTGGDLGVQGDVIYENKNLFRGAEVLQLKIKGGFEAQRVLGNQQTETQSETGLGKIIQLNTFDIGPELDLAIPRPLFPFNLGANIDSTHVFHHHIGLWPKANPQTVLKVSYNYQDLPFEYTRHIFGLAYTFNYDPFEKKDLKKWRIELKLPEINFVNAELTPDFQQRLISTNNYFLLNSFTNHFVPDLGFALTYNDQVLSKAKQFNYFRIGLEESGYLLRAFTPVLNLQLPQLINPDPNRVYSIFGVPYSYYAKVDADFRHYFVISKDDKVAFRVLAGIGIPMAGVPQELPFDKSYWGGGSNDIRAWNARTLGPGGYDQTTVVDQIGDIKIEANAEYRINVIKILGLAYFIDAGNIWLMHADPAVPDGNFMLNGPNNFVNQLAVGTGIGFRFDFTYFVFRIDLGVPIRDPARGLGDEWTTREISFNRMTIQVGIGYPF